MTALQSPGVYTDIHGLQSLKREAEKQTPDALRAVAQQFEALFVQQMLKSMRDAQLADGLFDSDASKFYTELYDKQISLNITQGQGMGLADLISEQLKHTVNQTGRQPLGSKPSGISNSISDPLSYPPSGNTQETVEGDVTVVSIPQHQLNRALQTGKNTSTQIQPIAQEPMQTKAPESSLDFDF